MSDPESDLRDRLQRCNADLIAALARYEDMRRKANALSHEVERLRERPTAAVVAKKPTIIYCQRIEPGWPDSCPSELMLYPLHDTDVPVLVRLAGWGVNEKGERLCKRCKEGL